MKQEDKDLLLRDLCARLPYGVKCQAHNGTLICVNANNGIAVVQTDRGARQVLIENLKPYIRPMDSMAEEEKVELKELSGAEIVGCSGLIYMEESSPVEVLFDISYGLHYGVIEWLNAHHFDYCGLIEKELALEAPKDMYDIK